MAKVDVSVSVTIDGETFPFPHVSLGDRAILEQAERAINQRLTEISRQRLSYSRLQVVKAALIESVAKNIKMASDADDALEEIDDMTQRLGSYLKTV